MVKDVSIIVQARMSSRRLPGKVLRKIEDKSVLGHIITRLKQSKAVKEIIVATSLQPEDLPVVKEAERYGARAFIGDLNDVLKRFYDAASFYNVEHVMRICADSPFIAADILDFGVRVYQEGDYDYLSPKGLPLGMGFEIFPFEALAGACKNAKELYQREHVTPYIIENAKQKHDVVYEGGNSHYRLTLDTKEDLLLAEELYKRLYRGRHDFTLEDIVAVLEKEPFLLDINKHVVQVKVPLKKSKG